MTGTPSTEQRRACVVLTAEQAAMVRRRLLAAFDDLGDLALESRAEIVDHLAFVGAQLERLDRLGWEDDRGTRPYQDSLDELARIGCELVASGAVALADTIADTPPPTPLSATVTAGYYMSQAQRVMAGLAILEQLDLPTAPRAGVAPRLSVVGGQGA